MKIRRPSHTPRALSIPLPTIYYSSPAPSPTSSTSSASTSSSDGPLPPIVEYESISFRSLKRSLLTRPFTSDDVTVPRSRKPRFDLTLQIHDLNNVPLVSGAAYVKWHLHNSTKGDARGRTDKAPIKEHKVTWRYERHVSNIRIGIDRNGILNEQLIMFEINQEYTGRERIMLGSVTLNLSEYAGIEKETRRYLMQDSKINSTIKITLALTQVSGDVNYQTPPLRGAQVFSGIAGIINDQQQQAQQKSKESHMTSLTTRSRETGAMQDMYRRNLAASWQCQVGDLNAEECIEDIFAGGDGWVDSASPSVNGRPVSRVGWWTPQRQVSGASRESEPSTPGLDRMNKLGEGSSDSDSLSGRSATVSLAEKRAGQRKSDNSSLQGVERKKNYGNLGLSIAGDGGVPGGFDSFGSLSSNSASTGSGRGGRKLERLYSESVRTARQVEVDEIQAREDLKSWCKPR